MPEVLGPYETKNNRVSKNVKDFCYAILGKMFREGGKRGERNSAKIFYLIMMSRFFTKLSQAEGENGHLNSLLRRFLANFT